MPSKRTRTKPSRAVGAGEFDGYAELLDGLKGQIRVAQVRAGLAVNRELVALYWKIGREILARQNTAGWGAKVVDRLAADLHREFPEMRGLSRTNLLYMRGFAEAYSDEAIVQQAVGQLPWGHNILLLNKLKAIDERLWYAHEAIENGWSRNVLSHHLEGGLHLRKGKALHNFASTLPPGQSDLASELLKDPYNFEFLGMSHAVEERELERALLAHIRGFLLELGVGFALVGSQYRLEVDGQDYHLDLLFFHIRLCRYVVVELKMGTFQPEYAGKMNFYLAVVDERLRGPGHEPSIGLVLCRERSRVVAEYALRGISKPIGVAEYRLSESLPTTLMGSLPTPEVLEKELSRNAIPAALPSCTPAGQPPAASTDIVPDPTASGSRQ